MVDNEQKIVVELTIQQVRDIYNMYNKLAEQGDFDGGYDLYIKVDNILHVRTAGC